MDDVQSTQIIKSVWCLYQIINDKQIYVCPIQKYATNEATSTTNNYNHKKKKNEIELNSIFSKKITITQIHYLDKLDYEDKTVFTKKEKYIKRYFCKTVRSIANE